MRIWKRFTRYHVDFSEGAARTILPNRPDLYPRGNQKERLYLPRGIDKRRTVSTEASTIGDGTVGTLIIGRVGDVKDFDAKLELARIRPQRQGLVKRMIHLGEPRSGQTVGSRVAKVKSRWRWTP